MSKAQRWWSYISDDLKKRLILLYFGEEKMIDNLTKREITEIYNQEEYDNLDDY